MPEITAFLVDKELRVSGRDVASLLAWGSKFLGRVSDGVLLGGGRYVWPFEGVKFGSVDAVDIRLVRDAIIVSCIQMS